MQIPVELRGELDTKLFNIFKIEALLGLSRSSSEMPTDFRFL